MQAIFDVQTQKNGRGVASVVYSRYGFEQAGESPSKSVRRSSSKGVTSRFWQTPRPTGMAWDGLGWTRQSDVPPVVVMRLNEEKIGGRAGYLQRLGTQDARHLLPGETGGGLAGSEHDLQYGWGDIVDFHGDPNL